MFYILLIVIYHCCLFLSVFLFFFFSVFFGDLLFLFCFYSDKDEIFFFTFHLIHELFILTRSKPYFLSFSITPLLPYFFFSFPRLFSPHIPIFYLDFFHALIFFYLSFSGHQFFLLHRICFSASVLPSFMYAFLLPVGTFSFFPLLFSSLSFLLFPSFSTFHSFLPFNLISASSSSSYSM